MIKLVLRSGACVEISTGAASVSQVLADMICDLKEDVSQECPLPFDNAEILQRVVAYCEWEHSGAQGTPPSFFDPGTDNASTLIEIINIASYIDIKGLFSCTATAFSDLLAEKTPAEIRQLLSIEDDLDPDVAEIHSIQNGWFAK